MLFKTWTLDGTVGGSGTGSDPARERALSRRLFLLSRSLNLEAIIHPLAEAMLRPNPETLRSPFDQAFQHIVGLSFSSP